ncbi:MAG: DivIVA domain-containing protein [Desulfomonilia bacterium]|jgi:cell division initiation protein
MQLTPEMIREQRFRSRFSGFDKEEVLAFLVSIAGDLEELMEENALLRSELDSMKARQKDIEDLFLSAKQFSDEKRRQAEQESQARSAEAQRKVSAMIAEANQKIEAADAKAREIEEQAQERAREVLKEAQLTKSALEKEIAELTAKRASLFSELRSILDSCQNWIREMGNVDPAGR